MVFSKENNALNRRLSFFLVSCLTFIYIYSPTVKYIPVTLGTWAGLAIIIWTILAWPNDLKKFLSRKIVAYLGLSIFSLALYLTFLDLTYGLSGDQLKDIYFFALNSMKAWRIAIELFLGSVCLAIIITKMAHNNENMISALLYVVASIQFIAVIAMIISPGLRDMWLFSIQKTDAFSFDDSLTLIRGYGISSNYLFDFPVFNGFLTLLVLAEIFFKRIALSKGFVLIIIAIVPIFLNARIGLLVPIIFLIYILLSNFEPRKLFIFIILSGMVIGLIDFIEKNDYFWETSLMQNYEWLSEGFYNHIAIFDGGQLHGTTLGNLLESIYIPQTFFGILAGEGRYIFANPSESITSDIGYIQQLFFGGLIYVTWANSSIWIFLIMLSIKTKDAMYKTVFITSAIAFSLVHFKGNIFSVNEFTKGVFLVSFIALATQQFTKRPPAKAGGVAPGAVD